MAFRTMDQALARKLIEQHQNVITPAAEMEAEVYKHSRCPVCSHVGAQKVTLAPKVVPTEKGPQVISAPFSSASPLIQGHGRCENCQTEYSPHTGVIIRQAEAVITHPGLTGGRE